MNIHNIHQIAKLKEGKRRKERRKQKRKKGKQCKENIVLLINPVRKNPTQALADRVKTKCRNRSTICF